MLDKIWVETLGRINALEEQVKNINNFIVPGVEDKSEPKPKPSPKPKSPKKK